MSQKATYHERGKNIIFGTDGINIVFRPQYTVDNATDFPGDVKNQQPLQPINSIGLIFSIDSFKQK